MYQYLDLVNHVLRYGTRKPNRTGVDTLSTFNFNYEIDLSHGFPLLTTKEISWKNIVVEMLWFLSGDTNISILKKHKCKFWDAWADPISGEVPSAYGHFWREFPTVADELQGHVTNDQIAFVVNALRKDPMSRRLVVSAWYPDNAQTSKLPPCHCMFIFNVQIDVDGTKTLCCHLTQRSCDVALGVPYNIASYALLTHIMAKLTGLKPGIFAHTLVDAHIYTSKSDGSMSEYDHVPGMKEQSQRVPNQLPELTISEDIKELDDIKNVFKLSTKEILEKFQLTNYHPHPAIPFKVAV